MGNIRMSASGQVRIIKIYANKREVLLTRSNLVLPLAADIIARLMGNFPIGKIDSISIYNMGLLLSTIPISSYTHPGTNQVQFVGIFKEDSFAGNFDELGLFASNMGQFARLAPVAGVKSNTEQLSITWTININLLSENLLEIFDDTFDDTFN